MQRASEAQQRQAWRPWTTSNPHRQLVRVTCRKRKTRSSLPNCGVQSNRLSMLELPPKESMRQITSIQEQRHEEPDNAMPVDEGIERLHQIRARANMIQDWPHNHPHLLCATVDMVSGKSSHTRKKGGEGKRTHSCRNCGGTKSAAGALRGRTSCGTRACASAPTAGSRS